MANTDGSEKIVQLQNVEIDPKVQEMLNQPLKDTSGLDPKDQEFLKLLIDKIEKKEIQLYQPSSLLNHTVYDKLDENGQGKADYDAFTLLATIREIYNLCKMGYAESYQVQNLVHRIRLTKERLETISGDIFII